MELFERFALDLQKRLEKDIGKLEQAVKTAQESGEDISAIYHESRDSEGEKLQRDVRLATRDILIHYIDASSWCGCGDCGGEAGLDEEGNPPSLERVTPVELMGHSSGLPDGYLNRILSALLSARELFGKHPFHHVIEGRIAFIVKREAGTGFRVPEAFDSYRGFKFYRWNDPWANYNCHLDLIRHGKPEMVPPEYR